MTSRLQAYLDRTHVRGVTSLVRLLLRQLEALADTLTAEEVELIGERLAAPRAARAVKPRGLPPD